MRFGIVCTLVSTGFLAACSSADSGATPGPSSPPSSEVNESPHSETASGPRLESVPCRFVVPKSAEGRTFRCADLTVPENRAKPEGTKIKLHVIIFKGEGDGPPTIQLNGGPGQASEPFAMGLALGYAPYVESDGKFLAQGDLVMFDQRGTGRSIPRLDCMAEKIDPTASDPDRACLRRHQAAGWDLGSYDSVANADDVHDLKVALGAPRVNLHGVSYGTRLALEVLRRHPDDVHATIIDAVVPAGTDTLAETMPNFNALLSTIFSACNTDARCNGAYPDLDGTLARVKDKLTATPFSVEGASFGWDAFVNETLQQLYSPGAAGYLPKRLHDYAGYTQQTWEQARRDGQADLQREIESVRADIAALPLGPEVLTRLQGPEGAEFEELSSDIADAMYLSVECSDSVQYETAAGVMAAHTPIRPALKEFADAYALGLLEVCRTWPKSPHPEEFRRPVTSSVPTLVIGGVVDPVTPAAWAERAAKTLSNSQLVIVPGGAHGLMDDCGIALKTRFLATPGPLDVSCAASQTLSFVVPNTVSSLHAAEVRPRSVKPEVFAHAAVSGLPSRPPSRLVRRLR